MRLRLDPDRLAVAAGGVFAIFKKRVCTVQYACVPINLWWYLLTPRV